MRSRNVREDAMMPSTALKGFLQAVFTVDLSTFAGLRINAIASLLPRFHSHFCMDFFKTVSRIASFLLIKVDLGSVAHK